MAVLSDNIEQFIKSLLNEYDEMVELQHKQRKLANEAEFYKRRSMPVDLANQLRANGHEIQLQQELIALRNKELVATSNKYEADRKRYLELTGGRPTGTRRAPGRGLTGG